MNKANPDMRQRLKREDIPYWKAADWLGVSESTFIRWMRHELPEEKKKQLIRAINENKS